MSESAPPASTAIPPHEKPSAAKKRKKPGKVPVAAKKGPAGLRMSELIVQAVSSSKECSRVSLAALKKALAAAGYDVEKNNSRIKLGLKSLVSKGILVQTKGTGASGSFKLNKKVTSIGTKPSTTKVGSKTKVIAKNASVAASKKGVKSPKTAKRPAVAKKPIRSPKKPKVVKPKKVKSPAKTKAVKPKAAETKVAKPKTAKPRKVAPKRK